MIPHFRETVAEYRAAARCARSPAAVYCIRWVDGFHVAMSFWSDGGRPIETQLRRGRRLCLQRRAARYSWHRGHRPEAGILVEYVREPAGAEAKAWERAAPAHVLADGLPGLELLAPPVWHRAPEAPRVAPARMLEAAE